MLIGLHGASRSGKDTVAGILLGNYGFKQIALATKIREILLDLDPWLEDSNIGLTDLYEMYGGNWDKIKAHSEDSVEWMIKLGQSARDRLHEDVWIDAALLNENWEQNIVISDIRQLNEVDFVRNWEGQLWYIERPGTTSRGMDGLLKDVEFDAHIVNDSTITHLEEVITGIMEG
jgi:hypothetical protein